MEDEGGVFAGDESHQNSDKIHPAEEHSDCDSGRKREISESRQQHLGRVVQHGSGHAVVRDINFV